ncbi:hypothetical protein [Flavobacterium sp. 102]|uniref:hypothetical protein n=1 Tax=Flavobacterium sp. 102 TaxID=2135623 RepID=UPI000EB46067|nr:hypothetical protein [Flavobacterium sp. 102]RKS00436.1 hypothetical protein C8C84_0046 [Flavobacterium sp. 102]
MIPHVDNLYFYSRKDNIIYGVTPDDVWIPLIHFKQKFPDVLFLEGQGLKYMKDYMAMWPELWENVYNDSKPQLTLF